MRYLLTYLDQNLASIALFKRRNKPQNVLNISRGTPIMDSDTQHSQKNCVCVMKALEICLRASRTLNSGLIRHFPREQQLHDVTTVSKFWGYSGLLTSRQTCEKLQCLYENPMSNNFRKTAVLKKYQLRTKATKQRIVLKILGGVPVLKILQRLV